MRSSDALWNALLRPHQELPAGVHSYPTIKGRRRFHMLQVFNLALVVYLLIHMLLVPVAVYLLQTGPHRRAPDIGYWYLCHAAIALLLWKPLRKPHTAYWLIYLAWFAAGYLPLMLLDSFVIDGALRMRWKTLSGVICYGSSLVFTCFLLYRLRMPTTAYLFKLKQRIMPRWRYAVPFAALGFLLSLFWFAIATQPAPGPEWKFERQRLPASIYE